MKKIVLFIVSVLLIGVIAMCSCIQNSKRIKDDKEKSLISEEKIIQDSVADIEEFEEQENQIDNVEEIEESNVNENQENDKVNQNETIIQEQPIIQKQQEVKQIQTPKVETSKVETPKTETPKVETPKVEIPKTETPKTETPKIETPKVENNIKTEELKRNDEMIARIKSVIQNNATEDMKNFGYEVVVDSSIRELTNQFTYTENRVKQKIAWKYGTIRIYAEDYYCNGQYIMTECYII